MLRIVTSRLARAHQVQSQEGWGQAGLRWQIECTQRQFLGSAQTASNLVVRAVPSPIQTFFFFNLRVFIMEEPQQAEEETLKSKDTQFAVVKLPECPKIKGKRNFVQRIENV